MFAAATAAADTGIVAWAVFVGAIIFMLALDLGVFHRAAHVVRFREAITWTIVWFVIAIAFAFWIAPVLDRDWSRQSTVEFVTGYILELSLSMDNVFVIALIFAYFKVPTEHQHRVLFWGILGALIMRGAMIGAGAALLHQFKWIFYFLGAFLVFTGIRMLLFAGDEGVHPEKNFVIRLARRFFPISAGYDGQRFITQAEGRRALTPLALVLIMVETTDLVFAVDSIPAIFAVTDRPFIVFTSNVFAILGLRSLYFVLAGAIRYFRFLKAGLSIVLIFIGAKMLLGWWEIKISTNASLVVVVAIILVSVLASILAAFRQPPPDPK